MNKELGQEQKAISNLGIKKLNKMQTTCIEKANKRQDMVLLSPTGSGKTLAFLLPVLRELQPNINGVQVMILVPSRELALQIESVFKKMSTGYKINASYGGHSMKVEKNNLIHPPAILVGTPGRIDDHMNRNTFDPNSIQTLVLDEFDKSLELGFQEEMMAIVRRLPNLQRRILTSATQAIEIPKFAGLTNPIKLDFMTQEDLPALKFKTVVAKETDKLEVLFRLLCTIGHEATLVFCNHREAVERISELLGEMGIYHDIFHGGLEQEDRERALLKYRNSSHKILVCTDLASRGLDIPDIKNIVHYQLPHVKEAFIHRNGRTARMHASGTAYLVLAEEETPRDYLDMESENMQLSEETILPSEPEWATLFIGAGKKDKVNKIDIVGLILKKSSLNKDELGLIEVKDRMSYAAVKREKIQAVLRQIKNERVKKKRVKIAISR